MGSNVMEPGDIATYANDGWKNFENFTTICTSTGRIHARGSFAESDPLSFALPLLLMQFSMASGAILLTSLFLKPLHQSIFVTQILGGIILGPSGLGRSAAFAVNFFPLRGFILLDIISSLGYMLYFFLLGVQMDPWILKKINKKTLVIGILTVALPLVLSECFSFLLPRFISMESQVAGFLPLLAQAESVQAFPTIAFHLGELKIINSEFGKMAMCSAMVSGLFSFCVTMSMVLAGQSIQDNTLMLSTVSAGILFTVFIIFIIRPAVLLMLRQSLAGAQLKQTQFVALLVLVLVTGFCSQTVGLHIYFGPLILGITIPAALPIASELREKLDFVTYWMFMPIFFVKNGLVVDIFKIPLKNYIIMQSVALVAALGKFLGAFLTSLYYSVPMADAITLGLVMNTQGLLELGLFKMMKKDEVIDNATFTIMCINMLIITGSVTPIITRLFDPSRRYVVYKRRTVMHARPDSELEVLVCLHDQDIVPTAIKLLEALNPTTESPLGICVLHLVELVGRARPLLIPHKLREKPSSIAGPLEGILYAFRYYEQNNRELVSVYAYTAISPCATMHDDAYTLALDRRASLVIVPFYKRFQADGKIESYQKAALIMNKNVLEKMPCSVAILVDRGLLKSSRQPLFGSSSMYRVGVIFLGGADDREALAIGARMAGHPNIRLTITRLVVDGNVTESDVDERRADNEFLSEFRQAMAGNYQVTYIEEVVMDGSGTVAVIHSMEHNYELVLVGRSHDKRSPLLSGLVDSSKPAELGAIAEILASAEFKGNTTVLVVQQHTIVVNERNERRKSSLEDPDSMKDEEEEMPIQGRSV